MAMQAPRLIESCYVSGDLQTATPGRRLGGYVLDALLILLTLGVGWLIWWLIVVGRGQTPGKQLLGMYVMREDGARAGGWYTALRELLVAGLLFGLLINVLTAGLGWLLAALWCAWDRERQCLWDKVASTYIAYSPGGYRPLTAAEFRALGERPPAAGGVPGAPPDSQRQREDPPERDPDARPPAPARGESDERDEEL